MILSDNEIEHLISIEELSIKPLSKDTIRENGVDLRLGREFCKLLISATLDTRLSVNPEKFYSCIKINEDEGYVIEPGSRVLATTMEYVSLPPDVIGFVNLRSTFARMGLSVPPTIIDAGFEGEITVEIIGGSFPVKIYPNQRFLHIVFARTGSRVSKPYIGKYKGQRGVRLPNLPVV